MLSQLILYSTQLMESKCIAQKRAGKPSGHSFYGAFILFAVIAAHFLSIEKNEVYIFFAALVLMLNSPEDFPILAWLAQEKKWKATKLKYYWF